MTRPDLLEDSRVFCIAPWTHLQVLTDGKVFPCCMSGHDPQNAVGDLQAGDTLDSAWNSPKMRALRLNMLAGQSSTLCQRCYANEDLGIESFRVTENRQMAHHVHRVERTDAGGGLDALHVPYLDLRVSNLCNLRCRICCHQYSTSWYGDATRLGLIPAGSPRQITAVDDPDRLWEHLRPLIPSLEHVHFAGGEPLIMPEHYRLLDELVARGRTDVRISYNTNFLVLRYKAVDVMSMWKRFPVVYVSASLDGMGARGDYMRKGQDWNRIEENRERLRRECPHVDFQVSATVSLMNVLHMPAFFRDWHEKGYVRPDRMKMYLLFEPLHYSVQGLPADLKRRVEDLYGEFIATYLTPLGEPAAELIDNVKAVVTHMMERDVDIRAECRRVTAELDVLRDESFAQTFPELADFAGPTVLDHARARRRLGDLSRAARDYDEAIRVHPGNPDAHAERGQLRLRAGDQAGALADFNATLELDPRHLQARLNRGLLLRERGEYTSALQDLEIAARADLPGGSGDVRGLVYIERGRSLRQRGDLDGALADLNRALALAATAASFGAAATRQTSAYLQLIFSERAVVKRALDDDAGSWQDVTAAVLVAPDTALPHINHAIDVMEHPGVPTSATVPALADPAHPATPALLYYARGVARRHRGEWDLAMADFDRALALAPGEHAPLRQIVNRMRQREWDPLSSAESTQFLRSDSIGTDERI